jgi:hypothetical protein
LFEVITTALADAAGLLVAAVFGTVGLDADFAVEEPHAASATVARARPTGHRKRKNGNDF